MKYEIDEQIADCLAEIIDLQQQELEQDKQIDEEIKWAGWIRNKIRNEKSRLEKLKGNK